MKLHIKILIQDLENGVVFDIARVELSVDRENWEGKTLDTVFQNAKDMLVTCLTRRSDDGS